MSRAKQPAKRRQAPKKVSAFKRKSRFLIPWPYLVMLFLSVGVLLVGWTFQAGAANLNVTAKVSAPFLTDPAVITSPLDGARFKDIPITVSGTCPADSYVSLYTNNVFRGSVICAPDQTFQLDIDLFPGANELKAQDFNITDDPGPASSPITVYYDAPVPPPPPPSPSPSPSPSPGEDSKNSNGSPSTSPTTSPFLIKSEFKYKGYSVGQKIQWKVNVSGGYAPYAFNIDWGDGTNSVVSKKEAGDLTLEHIYKKEGSGSKHIYTIKLSGSDINGSKAHLEIFVVINPSKLGGIVANTVPPSPVSKNWLLVAWPAYMVVGLMGISFWLGEKEIMIELKRNNRLRQRRT